MNTKNQTTWILIADSSRAKIMASKGRSGDMATVEGQAFRSPQRQLREILSDRPGRSFDSVGGGRHAMEYSSDARREDDRAFAKVLATALADALRRKEYDRLVLAAAPRTLGDLRASLPDQVKAVVCAEIDKDLTHIPDSRLPDHFEGILTA